METNGGRGGERCRVNAIGSFCSSSKTEEQFRELAANYS